MNVEIKRSKRKLPHWQADGATYFVTFRLQARNLSHSEIKLIRGHLVSSDGTHYHLLAAVVMPDHVHLLMRPDTGFGLSRVMKGIKGATARKLNQRRGTRGRVWAAESFDRIMRNQKELDQKLDYMYLNPVKARLVETPESYPGWYQNRVDEES